MSLYVIIGIVILAFILGRETFGTVLRALARGLGMLLIVAIVFYIWFEYKYEITCFIDGFTNRLSDFLVQKS